MRRSSSASRATDLLASSLDTTIPSAASSATSSSASSSLILNRDGHVAEFHHHTLAVGKLIARHEKLSPLHIIVPLEEFFGTLMFRSLSPPHLPTSPNTNRLAKPNEADQKHRPLGLVPIAVHVEQVVLGALNCQHHGGFQTRNALQRKHQCRSLLRCLHVNGRKH